MSVSTLTKYFISQISAIEPIIRQYLKQPDMRRMLALSIAVFVATLSAPHMQNPAKWNFSSKKIDATTYEISMTATLERGWHIYSQTTPEGGPVPTTIEYTKNPLVNLQGTAKETGKLEQRHEELFGVDVKQYSNKVDFVQTVKVKANVKTTLNGAVEFMTCNDHECLPPTKQSFSIPLK